MILSLVSARKNFPISLNDFKKNLVVAGIADSYIPKNIRVVQKSLVFDRKS